MITYFALIFGLSCGIMIGLGIWLSFEVRLNHRNYEISDYTPRDYEHTALPENP